MIFLESVGSRASLSAEKNRKMKIFRFFCVPDERCKLACISEEGHTKKVCSQHTSSFLQGPLRRGGRECAARQGEQNPRQGEHNPPAGKEWQNRNPRGSKGMLRSFPLIFTSCNSPWASYAPTVCYIKVCCPRCNNFVLPWAVTTSTNSSSSYRCPR